MRATTVATHHETQTFTHYELDEPVPYTPAWLPGLVDHAVTRVMVGHTTRDGQARDPYLIATLRSGRTMHAGIGLAGTDRDDELLTTFAGLIADAQQRIDQQAARDAHPAYAGRLQAVDPNTGELRDLAPVRHIGATREEQPAQLDPVNDLTGTPHLCSHSGHRVHVCTCDQGRDHGWITCQGYDRD